MDRKQLVALLNEEISRLEQVRSLLQESAFFVSGKKEGELKAPPQAAVGRRKITAEGRARVATAQLARWAKVKRPSKKSK